MANAESSEQLWPHGLSDEAFAAQVAGLNWGVVVSAIVQLAEDAETESEDEAA